MALGRVHLGIDAGTRAEIEHAGTRRQQAQRQLLKAVAHKLDSWRGQHELVVLLSGMHVFVYPRDSSLIRRLAPIARLARAARRVRRLQAPVKDSSVP
ncbi:hypothetical protein GCM10027021_25410 [Dyella kyungheensis]